MHIQPANENLSFKKIQLKKAEKDAVFSILKEVSTTTSTDKINRLREHLLSIYNDYLQKESLKYSFSYVHSSDFLQSLYLKFLSLFESIKKGEILPEEFVSELSDSKVEKNDTKRSALSIEQPLRKNKKSCIKNIITENDLPLPNREKTESEIKTIKNELYSLTEDVALNPKEISSFTGIGAGKSFKTLLEEFNASDYSIRRHLTSAIAKIQQKHNLLPEEFDAFVTDIIKKYNINKSKEDVINKLVKNAYDFSCLGNKLFVKVSEISQKLGISEDKIINIALERPEVIRKRVDSLVEKVHKNSEIIKVSNETFISLAEKFPQLLDYNCETIKKNINNLAKLFNLSEDNVLKIIVKQPNILFLNIENIKNNITNISKVINISEDLFLKAALKQPTLIYQSPESIKNNVAKSSKVFGISEKEFINLALKQPSFLYAKPETVEDKILKTAQIMKMSKEDFIKLSKSTPTILLVKPETIEKNITKASNILKISKSEFIELAKKRVVLLAYKPESIKKKIDILSFYKKVQKEPFKVFIPSDSEKVLYTKILSYLIKKNFEKVAAMNQNNFLEVIKKYPEQKMVFEIPKDKLAKEFKQFVKEFFEKNSIKNPYKFKIVESY